MPGNEAGNNPVSVLKSTVATRFGPPSAPPKAFSKPLVADSALCGFCAASAGGDWAAEGEAAEFGAPLWLSPAFARFDKAALQPPLPLASVPRILPTVLPTAAAPSSRAPGCSPAPSA